MWPGLPGIPGAAPRWTAERAYVTLSLTFGLVFVAITPPFQSPDEVNHFLRIYQISEGGIIGEKQGTTSGGDVPTAVWVEAHHFDRLPFDPEARTSADEIVRHLVYGPRFGQDTDGPRQFGAFPNTVRYSPVPYLPHVIALLGARAARVTVLAGAYICRLAALVVAILLIRASLRLVSEPVQWSLAALALLPMGLFITSMASPATCAASCRDATIIPSRCSSSRRDCRSRRRGSAIAPPCSCWAMACV